ncbi:MAG: hypothetical protein P4L53_03775 [Candidatus Obscuribacterales bacterium]|nr:hypothetical protein [Candidatus Obscuribacterales bacterium]
MLPPVTMVEMPNLVHVSSSWLNPEDTSCVRPALRLTPSIAVETAVSKTNRVVVPGKHEGRPDKRVHMKVNSPPEFVLPETIGGPGAKTEVCFPGAQSIFLPDEPEEVAAKLQMPVKLTMKNGSPVLVNPAQVAGVGTAIPGVVPVGTKTQIDIPDGSHLWVMEDVDAVAGMLHFPAKFTRPNDMVQYVNPAWVAHLFIPVKGFGAKEAKTQITIGTTLMYFVIQPIEEVAVQLKAAAVN